MSSVMEVGRASGGSESQPVGAPPVYDVAFNITALRWRVILVAVPGGLLATLVLTVLLAAFWEYFPQHPFAIGLIAALLLAPLVWWLPRVVRGVVGCRVARLLEKIDRDYPDALAPPPAGLSEINGPMAVEELGRTLAAQRDVPELHRTVIVPFETQFQPVPMNRRDARFQDMCAWGGEQPASRRRIGEWSGRRSVQIVALLQYAGLLGFGLVFIDKALDAVRSRYFSLDLGVYFFILLLGIIGYVQAPNWNSTVQWVLVPGALVRRLPGRSAAWKLHLFVPAETVVIVTSRGDRHWRTFVADAEQCGWLLLHRQGLNTFLRAWLSPCPPPTLAQLSDLV